ncbi:MULTISPECIES: GGDEF domain-containing protein [Bacillaceae]|uniref:Sensor domain-containing diguanylate cyclase n=1 Tax=Evansella alkalicola TaxID=745819 RepID=A0ABS6JR18_9BACI|nr:MULTISPECIES: sensor domain-containing diguanylate cyclase [Bacillaceae]MBU9720980.1 sensor domain-containing diguanylate cyclase [Bacillus alkalicola]
MHILIGIINLIVLILLNTARFAFSKNVNKGILISSSLLFTTINGILFGIHHYLWMVLFILLVTTVSYMVVGGIVATIILYVPMYFSGLIPSEWAILILLGYAGFVVITNAISSFMLKSNLRIDDWQKRFYLQSKNLHVLREVSLALQSTLNIEKLLHIFLTSITAGYGLGFNRAILFLQKEESATFTGKLGIGPLTVEQGLTIWESVTENKWRLKDLIQMQEKAVNDDHELNQIVRDFSFHTDSETSLMSRIVSMKEPFIIEANNGTDDQTIQSIRETFSMEQLAVIPLVSRGKTIGILLIDNIVNRNPIKYEDVDNIVPLATQTAMAIENAALYEQTNKMAIKDGLTGLYNKRFMDRMLPHLQESAMSTNEPLSALILDLDFFKRFNDTHGHLLGNEVLIQFSEVVSSIVQKEDIVCRFGGEEFVVLLPKQDLNEAILVGEKIVEAVRTHPFPGRESQPNGKLTVSIGAAVWQPGDGAGSGCGLSEEDFDGVGSINALLENADKAVYRAKELGKDQVYPARVRGDKK